MDHEENLNTLRTIGKAALLLAVPLFLIYEQPDMKNTIMIVLVFCVLIYIAGLSYRIIGGALLIAVPLMIIFLVIVAAGSDADPGLSEKPYHVLPVSGKRGVLRRY